MGMLPKRHVVVQSKEGYVIVRRGSGESGRAKSDSGELFDWDLIESEDW